jgi:hypothetical protein
VWDEKLLASGAMVKSHVDIAVLVASNNKGLRKLLGKGMVEWQEMQGLEELQMHKKNKDAWGIAGLVVAVWPRKK